MPLTEKQAAYLQNCRHRWNLKVGAVRSGKSFLDYAVVIPKRIMVCRGEGSILLMGNTQGTFVRNILEPMRDIWGEELVSGIHADNSVNLFGKKAYILGADNKKHVARIQGMTVEYAYGDEMTTWNEDVFQMLKSRLSCEHSRFDGTMNPDNPHHFMKRFLDSDADIYQQSYLLEDNPYLSPVYVENLKKEYTGTVFYDRYILGQWTTAEGLIYDMFNRKRYVRELDRAAILSSADQIAVSCDYGTQNATCFLLWARIGTTHYLVDEYYYSGRAEMRQKTDAEYADDYEALIDGLDVPFGVIDPSAASFIAELKRRGHKVRKANNNVLDGIRQTARMFSRGEIIIDAGCVNTIRELENYRWDPAAAARGEDRPVKVDDHAADALRYYVMTAVRTGGIQVMKYGN